MSTNIDPSWEQTIAAVGTLVATIAGLIAAYQRWGDRVFKTRRPAELLSNVRTMTTLDDAISYRAELRAEIRELNARCDELFNRLASERERSSTLIGQIAEYRAESIVLRQRYHRIMNWLHAHPGVNTVPSWLTERISGPTEDEARDRRHAEGQS